MGIQIAFCYQINHISKSKIHITNQKKQHTHRQHKKKTQKKTNYYALKIERLTMSFVVRGV